MIDYAWKNITNRPGRSILTVIGVTVMISLIICITGIVNSQKRIMNEHASAGAGRIYVQTRLAGSAYPAQGVDLPKDTAEQILAMVRDDIQEQFSTSVVFFELEPPLYPNNPPEVLLTGVETGKEEAFTGAISNDVQPVSGVEHFAESTQSSPAILGAGAAAFYGEGIGVGDAISVLGTDLTVIGILNQSSDQVVNSAVIVPIDLAQGLLDREGFVSSVMLTQASVGKDEEIISSITEAYPTLNLVDNNTIRRNLENGIKVFESMINVISLVVVMGAVLLIVVVMMITVKERTNEIGVLRAIGAPSYTIIMSLFWEIFFLSAAGSVLGGIISGFVMAFALPENLFNINHIASYLPLAVVLTLTSGLMPAFQISRIMPVNSLRHE